ncbi:unknown [Clostridium sp. CAG:1193]|jgi:hypothetical protein|nr:unknown [Clostridium sp. CAG:1193]
MTRWQRIKKVIKPKNIIVLIILLTSNTFAWFIYATKVQNEMSAHVGAWDILFESGDSPIVDYINVSIDNMYPGMEDFHYELKAYNKSEVGASLTYTLLSADIMGDVYYTKEGRNEANEEVTETDLTSEELIKVLKDNYPFKFDFSVSSSNLDADIGEAFYYIDANWPFESGNDELDTKWGIKASEYKKQHPDKPSIILKIKIYISQSL